MASRVESHKGNVEGEPTRGRGREGGRMEEELFEKFGVRVGRMGAASGIVGSACADNGVGIGSNPTILDAKVLCEVV